MSSGETLLLLLLMFQIKHLIADFVLQSAWMVQTKGIYGHPGGICHAGLHAVLTALILLVTPISAGMVIAISVGEFIIHYHLDWLKDHVVRKRGLTAVQKGFWTYAGLDQFAHHVTYLGIVLILLYLI